MATLTPAGLRVECRHILIGNELNAIELHAASWLALDDIAAREGISVDALVRTVRTREPRMALPTALELFCIRYWRERLDE
ncbi:ribbon-helix-helix domain-containing protein [Niveispirillum sp. KHB5.9]|uniref:ribbon-helix-helix domain-containing protein n=1 Tax=Niveispirillum sp. KHB5.9 TaxID=3400269 RepID=UPI003A862659